MKSWWKDTLERTARTFTQGFLAVVTLDMLTGINASLVDATELGALAGVYAVLTAFVAKGKGDPDDASFRGE